MKLEHRDGETWRQARVRRAARQEAQERKQERLYRNRQAREHRAYKKQLAAYNETRAKLVKALGLLASNRDGEVLAAARTVERLRATLGHSWTELLLK